MTVHARYYFCRIIRIKCMSTFRQLVYRYKRKTKRIRPLVPALKKCPQKRGVIQLCFIQTPKKPNSAKRKVAKVKLSTGRVVHCYLPGTVQTAGQKLTKHAVLLVRGGRAQDLIGVRYKPIFGKFDLRPPEARVSRRSKFGLSNKEYVKGRIEEGRIKKRWLLRLAKPEKPTYQCRRVIRVRTKRQKQKRTRKRVIKVSLRTNISRYTSGR